MTVGSLFAGIGGFDLGFERAGFRTLWQVEREPFCQKVLTQRFGVPILDDVTTLTAAPPVDVLVGGFPCQDVSVAGKRAGLKGERSGLFWEFLRIADALRPSWLVIENVPGLLTSRGGRDFHTVLSALAERGWRRAYRILDSQHFRVAQRRRRVFVVCHRGGTGRSPEPVLLEPASRPRHSPTRRETRPGVAATLRGRSHGAGVNMPGRGGEDDQNLITGPHTHGVRRLTPLECERLQGFPDGWTCLCGVAPYTTKDCRCPDTPRYNALGNAVTVTVAEWIARRLRMSEMNAEAV